MGKKQKRVLREQDLMNQAREIGYHAGLEAGVNKERERLEGLHTEDMDDRAIEMTKEAHMVVEAIGDKMTALRLKFEEGLFFTELIKSAMTAYQHANTVNQLATLHTKLEDHIKKPFGPGHVHNINAEAAKENPNAAT